MSIRGFQQEVIQQLALRPTTPPESCVGCANLVTKTLGALGVEVSMCQLEQTANERKSRFDPRIVGDQAPSRRQAPTTLWIMEAVYNPDSVNKGLIPADQLDFRSKVHRANDACPIKEGIAASIGQTFPGQPHTEVEITPPAPLVTYNAYAALSKLES